MTGVCFEKDKNCVTAYADIVSFGHIINAFTNTEAIAAGEPDVADRGYCNINEFGGFSSSCWFGKLEALADKV